MNTESQPILIVIFGEGIGDVGRETDITVNPVIPSLPTEGVAVILARRVCGNPTSFQTIQLCQKNHLRGKGHTKRVLLAKQRAYCLNSAACIYICDTERMSPKTVLKELEQGRDSKYASLPTAIGVAVPCIESWILADADAIMKGLKLDQYPQVPDDPESIPVGPKGQKNKVKILLDEINGQKAPNVREYSAIAEKLDLAKVSATCPSFAAFAAEVRHHILPLFSSPLSADTTPTDPQP